jgi:hypothetical protein
LFLYDVDEKGIITGGHSITLQNFKLESVKLLKRLASIDENDLKSIARKN